MNEHEITINAKELASELAALHLERVYTDSIVIWDDDGKYYTEEANEIFHILYMDYLNLIESTKIKHPMYQVTKTTHIAGQPIRTDWVREFTDENKAVSCLMEHAAELSLDNIREDLYYACSDGIKPEVEIEIVQHHDEKIN
jgi:hypothetical protein